MKTITEVEVSEGTQVIRYRTRPEVERALTECISKRFTRAYDSPFLQAPTVY